MSSTAIPLRQARICLDCDVLTDDLFRCPGCGGKVLFPLECWLGKLSGAKTELTVADKKLLKEMGVSSGESRP